MIERWCAGGSRATTERARVLGEIMLRCEEAVATLTIENPPMNCITTAMFHQLGEYVEMLEARDEIHAVVIHGGGPSMYTAGADVEEMDVAMRQAEDRAAVTRAWLAPIHALLERIEQSRLPYLCAMKGLSYGGGLEIAAACDIRLADQNARLAMPEAKLGIIPGYGGTQRLARLMGVGHTLALVLGGQEIRAEVAQQWGLVDLVTPPREAEPTAAKLARRMAGYAPLAIANAKRAIRFSAEHELAAGLAYERGLFIECAVSADFDEGRRAFFEKRAPRFGAQAVSVR